MNRQRLTGLVLITLALIAVLATSALRVRAVAGAAVVEPPPQVGDCWNPAKSEQLADQAFGGDGVVSLSLEPCDGTRLGEVVFVDNKRNYTQQNCTEPAQQYLGIPDSVLPMTQVGSNADATTLWTTAIQPPLTATVGPDPIQVAAGQLWSACVVLGVARGTTGDLAPLPFAGSLRDRVTMGGASFNRFAKCSTLEIADPVIPCDQPHRYEIFLQAYQLGSNEAESLQTCTSHIAELTGMPDASAGGRLKPVVLPVLYDEATGQPQSASFQEARKVEGSTAYCALTPKNATSVLTSTLYGLRDQALPIS